MSNKDISNRKIGETKMKQKIKKFNGIVVCCENLRFINDALAIKEFVQTELKIPTNITYPILSDKCIAGKKSNKLLICLSSDLIIKEKKNKDKQKRKVFSTVHYTKINRKDWIVYNSKKAIGKFAMGLIYDNSHDIVLDMVLIKKILSHPLDVVLHELLHLERVNKECTDKCCLGRGYNLKHERGIHGFCDNCRRLLNKVVNKYFKMKLF